MQLNEAKKILKKNGYKIIKESVISDENYYAYIQNLIDHTRMLPLNMLLTKLKEEGFDIDDSDVSRDHRTGVVNIPASLDLSDDGDDLRFVDLYAYTNGVDDETGDVFVTLQDYHME